MTRFMLAACLAVSACLCLPRAAAQEPAQDNPVSQLPWQHGPATGRLGDRATIRVPAGYAFLDADATRDLNELLENPPTQNDEYVLAPDDMAWIAFFSFSGIGYVKDDETLDADAMLESIGEGVAQGNEQRRDRGWDTLRLVGWSSQPQYDTQLNALAWAILLESEASRAKIVNYNTRLLGRRGVMEVTVAADPGALASAIADFKSLVPGYAFATGETYGEFQPGDHVAEIGLAALITGGAIAVASKKGWLAALGLALAKGWKLLLIGLVAVGAGARRFFGGRDKPGPR